MEGQRGTVELELRVAPKFDYGEVRPWIRRHGHRLHSATGGNDALLIWCEQELVEDPSTNSWGGSRSTPVSASTCR